MALMASKRKAFRNACISVNAVFHETLQVLILAYSRILWIFLANGFLKNYDFRAKISERSTLR